MSGPAGEAAGGVPPADDLRARAAGLLATAARLWSERNQKRWIAEAFIGELPVGVNQSLVVSMRRTGAGLLFTQRIWLQQPDGSRLATSWGLDLPVSALPALMGVMSALAESILASPIKRTRPSEDVDRRPEWATTGEQQGTDATATTLSPGAPGLSSAEPAGGRS
jgi:hypothetical protein